MKGLVYLKNFAMTYIVVLFVTALVGQPVLNGIIISNQTTIGIINNIIEEEQNEEFGDEDSSEISIDCQLPNDELVSFRLFTGKIPTIKAAKRASLIIEMFIPPPEFV